MTVEAEYRARFDTSLLPIAVALKAFLQDLLEGQARIDRISTRPKSVERFVAKENAKIGEKPM